MRTLKWGSDLAPGRDMEDSLILWDEIATEAFYEQDERVRYPELRRAESRVPRERADRASPPAGCDCTVWRAREWRMKAVMTAAGRAELERLLQDDVPYGDLTTSALAIDDTPAEMTFTARDPMIAALVEDAAEIIRIAGGPVDLVARSGDVLQPGAAILAARGPAGALLRGWKVAQTLIEVWSGVATAAREIVTAARAVAPDVAVACTRKNVPGTKRFSIAAIGAGGAAIHRLGLSETVLVFPEHLALLGDVDLAEVASRLRRAAPEKKLVIEVKSVDDALAAAAAGFDVIQAEKFSPADISALVARLPASPRRPVIAAAGGINASNAAEHAAAGADVLVTSAPYVARPRDVQVRIRTGT
jgi:molybdenum transport protein